MAGGRPRTGWDGHLLLLHRDESERLARLVAWTRRGLQLGERVVHAAGPRTDRLFTALMRQGVNSRAAHDTGLLQVLAPEDVGSSAGRRRAVDAALGAGFAGVRLAVSSAGDRQAPGADPTEREVQELCRSGTVSVLCQYERDGLRGGGLRDAVAVHRDGVRTTILTTRPTADGLAVAGEVDASNADVLAAALHAAARPAPGLVWLHLAELRFLDVAGARALVHATQRFRRDGGVLLLDAPRPPVEHAVRLLGIDDLPGMVLVADGRPPAAPSGPVPPGP